MYIRDHIYIIQGGCFELFNHSLARLNSSQKFVVKKRQKNLSKFNCLAKPTDICRA